MFNDLKLDDLLFAGPRSLLTHCVIGGNRVEALNARHVWKFLGVKTKFLEWIRLQLRDTGAVEHVDYITTPEKHVKATTRWLMKW